MRYVLAYDIGTTGIKTCLFGMENTIKQIASATCEYNLYIMDGGKAEQDPDEWWNAMCVTTNEILKKSGIDSKDIEGISFCSQMQGLVLVDKEGKALRRAMSYMDQRATKELKEGIAYGFKIAGANIFKLIPSLIITGAVSSSVKDPMWKYLWVKNNEPEIYSKIYKWLDVKEYIICRCTGKFIMTRDSAFSTMLYDLRKGHECFSEKLCKMFGVNIQHMPDICEVTDMVGGLTESAAAQLGLMPGTKVFGGGGDATLIGVGAGCVQTGDTHIYSGTSGWVSTITEKQMVDANNMIAAIIGAQKGKYNYFAEMETAGKCLEWMKNHLCLDEIGIYLEKMDVTGSSETVYTSLYDYMTETVKDMEPGAGGVIFTPWLHGNRCPFEDPAAAGMFFNIRLETGKTEMIRAVLEGVCYHLRWMLECQDKKLKTAQAIRFCGGGALSDVTSQILADITGHTIEIVKKPQDVGAVGAAATIAVGIGLVDDLENIKSMIEVEKTFEPNFTNKDLYDKNFEVFKNLYKSNKKNFRALNQYN